LGLSGIAATGEPLLVPDIEPEAYRARARPERRAFFDGYRSATR
jgi:hypothetical protein